MDEWAHRPMTENECRASLAALDVGPMPLTDELGASMLKAATGECYGNEQLDRITAFGASVGCINCEQEDTNNRFFNPNVDCYKGDHGQTPAFTPCLYCWSFSVTQPCQLVLPLDALSNQNMVCALRGGVPAQWHTPHEPAVKVGFQAGYQDGEGNSEDFWAPDLLRSHTPATDGQIILDEQAEFRYMLGSRVKLTWHPCADYLPIDGWQCTAVWICRIYTRNEEGWGGWKIRCNTPNVANSVYSSDIPLQNVARDLTLLADTSFRRSPLFVRFGVGRTDCWLHAEHYCMGWGCTVPIGTTKLWSCVQDEGEPDGASQHTAIDNLYLLPQISINEDPYGSDANADDDTLPGGRYPHGVPDDIAVKRLAWREFNSHFAQEYTNDHVSVRGTTGDWDADIGHFSVGTQFANRIVRNADGTPYTMYLRDRGGRNIPARLTLGPSTGVWETIGSMTINVEVSKPWDATSGSPLEYRSYVAAHFRVELVPMLYADSYTALQAAGLVTLNPDDPFETSIRDPRTPTAEHPHIRLLHTGANGGRIPQFMSWHGLKSVVPFDRGSNARHTRCCVPASDPTYGDPQYGGSSMGCCEYLHELNRIICWGEQDDHGQASPTVIPRYGGYFALKVRGLMPGQHAQLFWCQCYGGEDCYSDDDWPPGPA